MSKTSTPVWDIAVRLFHWSLVIGFTTAWLTAEEEDPLHIISGYLVLALILFRVIWGFIGGRHARFSDFLYAPGTVIDYLKSLKTKPRHYLGHNPAGGWMVILMLLTLFGVTLSGLKVYGLEGHGPLATEPSSPTLVTAASTDEDEEDEASERASMETSGAYEAHEADEADEADEGDEEFWEEIHETLTDFMLLLIALHILGVIVSSRLHGENLVRAMITGNKEKQD